MSSMPTFHDALHAWERHKIFPLAPKSKKPRKGDDWRKYESDCLMIGDVRRLWGFEEKTRYNIGILAGASQAVIVDADSKESARELCKSLPKTDMITITPNGGHLFFQAGETKISPMVKAVVKGITCDIRAGSSYVVAPGSIHPSGQPYERHGGWNWEDVPVFDPDWIEPQKDSKAPRSGDHPKRDIRDPAAYIAKIESISGSNGSAGLIRATSVLRDADVPEAQALLALQIWNKGPTVNPPWPDEELARAITRTYQKGVVA